MKTIKILTDSTGENGSQLLKPTNSSQISRFYEEQQVDNWVTKEYPNDINGFDDERQVLIKDIKGGKHLGYCTTQMRAPEDLAIIWQVYGIGIMETDEVYGWMELSE